MEQVKSGNSEVQTEQKSISQFFSKFVSVLMSIMTGCVMLLVGFIWQLKADFATERQTTIQTLEFIKEIRSDIKEDQRNIQSANDAIIRMDARLNSLEEKIRNRNR